METVREPQLLEEVEALVGPFFVDEIEDQAELGFKTFAYRACCRILATARAEDRALARNQPDYEVNNWNDQWEITARKLAEIAFRYEKETTHISRQLAIVNGAAEYMEEHWGELQKQLFPDQRVELLGIVDALQKAPRRVAYQDDLGEVQEREVSGVTLVAPTGSGKSVLLENCCKLLSAGQPLMGALAGGNRRCRQLVIAPSRIIQNQLAKQLRQAFPDLDVGKMSGEVRQPSADIVVSTIDMYNQYFQDGCIDGQPVDVTLVDESHHLTEPQFRKTFLEQGRGLTITFTATPAYSLERDVRDIIPHVVERNDILSLIEKGRLNEGRIYSFLINKEIYRSLVKKYGVSKERAQANEREIMVDVIDSLVIEFLTPLLNEGRRGIVFCERGSDGGGNHGVHAVNLAKRLSAITLDNGTKVVAAPMLSHLGNTTQVQDEYQKGNIHVLTTVDSGREGMNADIDFVIVNCNVTALLRLRQIVGRGTRKSKRFPTTMYAQFSRTISSEYFYDIYSIEEVFGYTRFKQGRRIGSKQRGVRSTADQTNFPDIIQELLQNINGKPIGETLVRGTSKESRRILEGMVPLRGLIADYRTTEATARRVLHEAGFEWRGTYEEVDGVMQFQRYYMAEGAAALTMLPKKEDVPRSELPALLGASVAMVARAIATLTRAIQGRRVRMGSWCRPAIYYTPQEVQVIARTIEEQKGESTRSQLSEELGVDEAVIIRLAGVENVKRRRLTPREVAKARAAFNSIPWAEDGDKTLTQMAEAMGIHPQVLGRNLTVAEDALATPKRFKDKRGYARIKPMWSAEDAAPIMQRMERLQPKKLPAHILPSMKLRQLVKNFAVTPAPKIREMVASGGYEFEEVLLVGTRGVNNCLSWSAIAHLESILGRKKGKKVVQLNFDMLPNGPDDRDPAKIAYAQAVQRCFGYSNDQLEQYE